MDSGPESRPRILRSPDSGTHTGVSVCDATPRPRARHACHVRRLPHHPVPLRDGLFCVGGDTDTSRVTLCEMDGGMDALDVLVAVEA